MEQENSQKKMIKHTALRSKMVGNETHRSYGDRLKGAKNLETLRGKKTQDRLKK